MSSIKILRFIKKNIHREHIFSVTMTLNVSTIFIENILVKVNY